MDIRYQAQAHPDVERQRPDEASNKFAEWQAEMQRVAGRADVIVGKQRRGETGTVANALLGPLQEGPLMQDLVPAIDPDVLVACVTEIDRLHASKGYAAATPEVMVVGVRRYIRNTETAVAALERIEALVEALADYPDIMAHYPASSTIPGPLTRAATATRSRGVAAIGAVFKAVQAAALALRDAGGRA